MKEIITLMKNNFLSDENYHWIYKRRRKVFILNISGIIQYTHAMDENN